MQNVKNLSKLFSESYKREQFNKPPDFTNKRFNYTVYLICSGKQCDWECDSVYVMFNVEEIPPPN